MALDLMTIGSMVIGGSSAFNLDELTQRDFDPQTELVTAAGAGQPAASFAASTMAEPTISATTTELTRALTHIDPLVGLAIDSGGSAYTSLNCFFTRYLVAAVRKSGSNHYKVGTITKALFIPKQLQVEQQGDAKLSFDCLLYTTDGATQPYTYTDSVALPHTPAVDQLYTLGPGSIGGTAVNALVSLTYDFGLKPLVERGSGEFYPTFVGIDDQMAAKLTIRAKSAVNMSTFSVAGAGFAQSSTASDFYLLRRKNRESTYATNATEHIRLRINASQAIWTAGPVSDAQGKPTEIELVATPIVGAAALVTIGLGVALP